MLVLVLMPLLLHTATNVLFCLKAVAYLVECVVKALNECLRVLLCRQQEGSVVHCDAH
jgi:hypothetical protein